MDFSEFYNINEDAKQSELANIAWGGKTAQSTRERGPQSGEGKIDVNKPDFNDDDKDNDDVDVIDPPEPDDDDKDNDEDNDEVIYKGSVPLTGGWIWTVVKDKNNEKFSKLYDYLSSHENLMKKSNIKNGLNYVGTMFTFKPLRDDSNYPNKLRRIGIFKNKPYKEVDPNKNELGYNHIGNKNDYLAITYGGNESFKDGLFYVLKNLYGEKGFENAIEYTKWYQAAPGRTLRDPYIYSKWNTKSKKAVDNDDKNATRKLLLQLKNELSNNTSSDDNVKEDINIISNVLLEIYEPISFSSYYNQETLNEEFLDLDSLIHKTIKNTGGGLKTMFIRPKIINIKSPKDLNKYFPKSTSYVVSKNTYMAINSLCAKSISLWDSTKKEFGLVAQQYLKTVNSYVTGVWDIHMKTPNEKDENKVSQMEEELDTFMKSIGIEGDDYEIEDIRVHKTTDFGMINTMQVVEYLNTNKDEDEEKLVLGDEEQTEESEPNEEQNNNIENLSKEEEDFKSIYVVGVDDRGNNFFKRNYGYDIKKYIQRTNRADINSIISDNQKMEEYTNNVLQKFMKNENKLFQRVDIPNDELNKIIQNFDKLVNDRNDKKLKSLDKKNIGDKVTLNYTVLDEEGQPNGKVSFVNSGPGTEGKIVTNDKALYLIQKVDNKKYKPVKKEEL